VPDALCIAVAQWWLLQPAVCLPQGEAHTSSAVAWSLVCQGLHNRPRTVLSVMRALWRSRYGTSFFNDLYSHSGLQA